MFWFHILLNLKATKNGIARVDRSGVQRKHLHINKPATRTLPSPCPHLELLEFLFQLCPFTCSTQRAPLFRNTFLFPPSFMGLLELYKTFKSTISAFPYNLKAFANSLLLNQPRGLKFSDPYFKLPGTAEEKKNPPSPLMSLTTCTPAAAGPSLLPGQWFLNYRLQNRLTTLTAGHHPEIGGGA